MYGLHQKKLHQHSFVYGHCFLAKWSCTENNGAINIYFWCSILSCIEVNAPVPPSWIFGLPKCIEKYSATFFISIHMYDNLSEVPEHWTFFRTLFIGMYSRPWYLFYDNGQCHHHCPVDKVIDCSTAILVFSMESQCHWPINVLFGDHCLLKDFL